MSLDPAGSQLNPRPRNSQRRRRRQAPPPPLYSLLPHIFLSFPGRLARGGSGAPLQTLANPPHDLLLTAAAAAETDSGGHARPVQDGGQGWVCSDGLLHVKVGRCRGSTCGKRRSVTETAASAWRWRSALCRRPSQGRTAETVWTQLPTPRFGSFGAMISVKRIYNF